MKKTILTLILSVNLSLFAGSWSSVKSFSGGRREAGVGFTVSDKGYVFGGLYSGTNYNDLWNYSPATNSWTQKASMPGSSGRAEPTAFVIGSYAYVGLGAHSGGHFKDFYKYDPNNNSWTSIADFPENRRAARGFAIDSLGYVLGGFAYGSTPTNKFWAYSPTQNKWIAKADLPSSAPVRSYPCMVSTDGKGYVMGGFNSGSWYKDFYEYNPTNNSWTQLTDFPGAKRTSTANFNIDGILYFGLGSSGTTYYRDVYAYNIKNTSWSKVDSFPSDSTYGTAYFSLLNNGYIVAGQKLGITTNRAWKFSPNIVSSKQIEKENLEPKIVKYNFYNKELTCLNVNTGTVKILIFSSSGQQVFYKQYENSNLQASPITLDFLKAGIYYIQAINSVSNVKQIVKVQVSG